MTRLTFTTPLALAFVMALALWGALASMAHAQEVTVTTHDVVLSQESVQAVAGQLAHLVDQQAAALHQATQPDIWDDAWDHMLVTFINVAAALVVVCLIFAVMIVFAFIGGLRSLREVRDAVDEWREFAKDAPQLAGMILLSGAIVAGLTIHAIYGFLAAVSTPHG